MEPHAPKPQLGVPVNKNYFASLTWAVSLVYSDTVHMPVCVRPACISEVYVVYLGKVPIKGKSSTFAFRHYVSPPISL